MLKPCSACETPNRAFANFCRSCGESLPSTNTNWTAHRGNGRRLGLNPVTVGSPYLIDRVQMTLRLGDSCSSLLGYDGHLVAVSIKGLVEIVEPARNQSVCRFQVAGAVTSDPCIHNGVLYVTAGRQLVAYALSSLTLNPPRVRPLWSISLDATPVHPLTVAGGRLYVTLANRDGREVHVLDDLLHPANTRLLYGARQVSWVAADPQNTRALFFSDDGDGNVQLHTVDRDLITNPVLVDRLGQSAIAVIGDSVFGSFGETNRLYRIDSTSGSIEEPLEDDTQLFALSADGDDEWDRDAVYVDTSGVSFVRPGVRDTFEPHDRATKGSPLMIRDSAVLIGMQDGRVRIYDLAHLPSYETWLVAGGSAISALASFESYVAAGNTNGFVEVRQIRARGRS